VIGEVAKRSGVAASALRFYEERGLIQSEREGSGQRRYPRSALRRIAFIVFAQRIGLTLDEIATELDKLPPDRAPTGRDWSQLSSTWTARIDEKIAELERRMRVNDRVLRYLTVRVDEDRRRAEKLKNRRTRKAEKKATRSATPTRRGGAVEFAAESNGE